MGETSNEGGAAPDAERQPGLLEASEYERFLLRNPKEILAILRRLRDDVSLITAFFDAGREMLLTSLLDVDEQKIILDIGADPGTNRKALDADKLHCVASHEKVRIQFDLGRLTQVGFEGGPAFAAVLPSAVLRLQRRDFFRLTLPVARPLKCLIPQTAAEGNTEALEANIVDISGGGVALAVPKGMTFERDAEFPECRIELPEVGTIVMNLRVRNVFEVELRSGVRVVRAGCAYVNPSGAMLAMIQRYIMKVERERKARESGLL
ncbi:MAG TPA: flagellar brake protein [Rhodocyclaceae bacterium]